MVVRFPPHDAADGEGWVKALLSDLAGPPDGAAELLAAVQEVQSGRIAEWSMNYNVYEVVILPSGARINFMEYSCSVSLELLESVVARHLPL